MHHHARCALADRFFHAKHPIAHDTAFPGSHRLIRYRDGRDQWKFEMDENRLNVLWELSFDYWADIPEPHDRNLNYQRLVLTKSNDSLISHIQKDKPITEAQLKIVDYVGDISQVKMDLLLIILYSK